MSRRKQTADISIIIPMINNEGLSVLAVCKRVRRTEVTVWRWVRQLRTEGHIISTRKRGTSNKQII